MRRVAIAYVGSAGAGAIGSAQPSEPGLDGIDVCGAVGDGDGPGRGGLGASLERIAAGEAGVLLVPRLDALAGSLRELIALLDWLASAGADLVALDVGLDTGSDAGRRTVATLRELERWERMPGPGRAPRGRPGLAAHAPELGERIAALRAGGLSMRAIADALDAEGVPTPRGGARWRASSVQAALGYRRPRPPVPGAPAPPGPRHEPGVHMPPGERPHPAHGDGPHPTPRPESRPPHAPGPRSTHPTPRPESRPPRGPAPRSTHPPPHRDRP